ncbi:hypothetical protein AURDEDRAFT_180884 [Auricularia subglabra TFB-10046 SS5]|nr:hypothetical protein AURDEDRAFT_180884 [Auricularia subglabra TFB-10046 SS5]
MSTTATTTPRAAPRRRPSRLVLAEEVSPTETLAAAQWAVPPVMPDVFVVAPDGESSFCAFSADQSGAGHALECFLEDDELPPSPSAPDFDELDRALDFLQRGAEELSPRRRRAARRRETPPEDVLSWLHRVDDEAAPDAPEEPEDLVKSRAPRPETPPAPEEVEAPRPSTPSPAKGLRNKASLVFTRVFAAAAAKAPPPAEAVAPATQSAALPIASTAEPTQPEQPQKQHPAEPPKPRRAKSRLFFNKLFSSSQNGAPAAPAGDNKSKPSKSSFLRRSKKPTKTSQPKENSPAAGLPSKAREAEDEPTPRPSPKPSIQGLRRRPFSSLTLASFVSSNKSSVKFPPVSRPSDGEAPPNSPTSSRNTTDSSATAVSSHSPYGDHETSSSASSSLTTLGNGPTLVHSTLPGFHSKRLDSLHFDSATFFDPTSYSFTTR